MAGNEARLNWLLAYLDRLTALQQSKKYDCYAEIDECISEVRKELNINDFDDESY